MLLFMTCRLQAQAVPNHRSPERVQVGPKAPGVVGGDAGGLTFHTRSGALAVETLDDGRLQMDFPVYQNAARPDLIDSVGHALGAAALWDLAPVHVLPIRTCMYMYVWKRLDSCKCVW